MNIETMLDEWKQTKSLALAYDICELLANSEEYE